MKGTRLGHRLHILAESHNSEPAGKLGINCVGELNPTAQKPPSELNSGKPDPSPNWVGLAYSLNVLHHKTGSSKV